MKKIIFCIVFISISVVVCSQPLKDTIYNSFTKCMYAFFTKKFDKLNNDTVIIIFENNPVTFATSNKDGSIYHAILKSFSSDSTIVDTSYSEKSIFFDRRTKFSEFLNFFISTKYKSRPQISSLTGIWAYVYMPAEEWQQYFLDQFLGYDSLYVNPIVDVFSFENNIVMHRRYRLNCYFDKKLGFITKQSSLIRSRKIEKNNDVKEQNRKK